MERLTSGKVLEGQNLSGQSSRIQNSWCHPGGSVHYSYL